MSHHTSQEAAFAIGQGYSITMGPLQTAMEVEVLTTDGGKSEIEISICSEEFSLKESLEINVGRSIALDGVGSYSDKLKLFRKLDFDETSLSIVVKAVVVARTMFCKTAALNEYIPHPHTESKLVEFCKMYGDSYVSELVSGSQYFAIYTYRCSSLQDKETLKMKIKASGIAEGIVVGGTASSSISSVLSHIDRNWEFCQVVIGSSFVPSQQKDVIENAFAFLSSAAEQTPSTTLRFKTQGYEHVLQHPAIKDALDSLAANRQILKGNLVYEGFLNQESRVLNTSQLLERLEQTLQRYGCALDLLAQDRKLQLQHDLNVCDGVRRTFDSAPTTKLEVPNLPSAGYGTPSIHYEAKRSLQYGGGGGDAYDDITPAEFLERGLQVASIELRGNSYVDQIVITYRDQNNRLFSYTHGEPNGNQYVRLALGKADYVTEVRVPYSAANIYLDYIQVKTRSQPDGAGVGGNNSNLTPIFSRENDGNQVFVGFFGRCGRWNDALGAVWLIIKRIDWN